MKRIFLFIYTLLFTITGCGKISLPPRIIDSHIHYERQPSFIPNLVAEYRKYNAIACIMTPMEGLDVVAQAMRDYPDMIVGFGQINIDTSTVMEDIEKFHAAGFKGLGELFATNKWNYDDEHYFPIWKKAEELGMVVLLHTGILSNGLISRMRPGYLGTISVHFPKLTIIGAHFGNPWYDEAGEIARRCKNVYFDITGSSLIKKEKNLEIFTEYLWWTPYLGKPHMPPDASPAFEKLIFGTDESPEELEPNIQRFTNLIKACNVDEITRNKMWYSTMAKILTISK